jgi:hypothetical protein
MLMQLETDSVAARPKGRVTVTFADVNGKTVAIAASEEIGTGGKPPGHAAIRNFSSSASVPIGLAKQGQSTYVDPECTGSVNGFWNLDWNDVLNEFNIIISVVAAS